MDTGLGTSWGGLLGILRPFWEYLTRMDLIALSIALLIPLLLVYGRNEVRSRRLRVIADFISSYPTTKDSQAIHDSVKGVPANPSLEFVASKYTSDLRATPKSDFNVDARTTVTEIEGLIRQSWLIGNRGDFKLLISSIGFIVLCYYGFHHLHQVIANGIKVYLAPGDLICGPPGGLFLCSSHQEPSCPKPFSFGQVQLVGALAFGGAFIAASRIFIRSLAVFDLSAYTFLRQSVEIFASVMLVIFLYRAFPNPVEDINKLLTGSAVSNDCQQVMWAWVALAPLLGLLPQSASKFLLVRMQTILTWIKMDDDRFNSVTRSIPLDVIDGIDYTTRFRLEECGIYDVQNLATYNPILLYIESPYGIYQTIDWVAQAQLCSVLGLDRFLIMREMHVRTIFDLERAIQYKTTQVGGKSVDGPEEFDAIYAGILFAATGKMRRIAEISGINPLTFSAENKVVAGNIDAFCEWARAYISQDNGKSLDRTKVCVEHLLAWMADDLHVRRLRRIWQEMTDSLGSRSESLGNSATTGVG